VTAKLAIGLPLLLLLPPPPLLLLLLLLLLLPLKVLNECACSGNP
jgi:hypothetical protein